MTITSKNWVSLALAASLFSCGESTPVTPLSQEQRTEVETSLKEVAAFRSHLKNLQGTSSEDSQSMKKIREKFQEQSSIEQCRVSVSQSDPKEEGSTQRFVERSIGGENCVVEIYERFEFEVDQRLAVEARFEVRDAELAKDLAVSQSSGKLTVVLTEYGSSGQVNAKLSGEGAFISTRHGKVTAKLTGSGEGFRRAGMDLDGKAQINVALHFPNYAVYFVLNQSGKKMKDTDGCALNGQSLSTADCKELWKFIQAAF